MNIVAGALAGTGPGAGWRIGPDEAAAGQLIVADMRNGTIGGPAHTLQAAGIGSERGGNPNAIPHVLAYGGNNGSGAVSVSTALTAHPGGRYDYDSETFVAHTLRESLREAGCQRCASQGWQPPEQLTRQLGAYLSELSQPGAQPQRFMRDLWVASEGSGLLREALSAVQEVGRSAGSEAEPAHRGAAVRRLTPWECEFLQGFPRSYTAIPWRGKPASECPDGPRYKALGNSWAVNCARWIGRRISLVEQIHDTTRNAA